MIADCCRRVDNNPPPPPEHPAHVNGDTPESLTENRRLEREFRDDMEGNEERTGPAAAIIYTTLMPIAQSYVKGMTEPLTMWNTFRERLSPCDNVGCQQSLRTEFNLLTFNNKEDIIIHLKTLLD